MILFVHGVPDTPYMWTPLIKALGLAKSDYHAPALPGFTGAPPSGFSATKDAYADWLIAEIETAAQTGGPVDIVGHDWGALLVQRAASLRPELIKSWCVSNALIDPDYRWHTMARRWQTPLLGEFIMSQITPARMKPAFMNAGLPADMAAHEAAALNKTMRQCILKLYRSAKHAGSEWAPALANLPPKGMVFWGAQDAYVPLETATRFTLKHNVPLHIEHGAGHWAIVERADTLATRLKAHWDS